MTACSPSPSTALLVSILITTSYVLLLYLPFNTGPRDAPRTILARSLTTILFTAALLIISSSPPTTSSPIAPALFATLQTLILYPTVSLPSPTLPALRNIVIAPLMEELVFRLHARSLYACFPPLPALILPSLIFGCAHLHHIRRVGAHAAAAMLAYTTVFGIYAAWLLRATGSVAAPIAAHVVCNAGGLPEVPPGGGRRYGVRVVLFALGVWGVERLVGG